MPSGFGAIISELISPTKYPKVPAAPYVNPQVAQMQTATGNAAALPTLESTSANLNTFNYGQRAGAVTSAVPGFNNLTNTASSNLLSFLKGQVPQGVQDQLSLADLSKATAGGYAGSGAAHNLEARDLGLTSLQLSQYGQGALNPYLSTMANLLAPLSLQSNPAAGFLTPGQTISADQWNETNRFNTQATENAIASLPDPLMRAVGNFAGDVGNIALTALTAYAGGALGGIGGAEAGGAIGNAMGSGGGAGGGAGGFFANIFAGG